MDFGTSSPELNILASVIGRFFLSTCSTSISEKISFPTKLNYKSLEINPQSINKLTNQSTNNSVRNQFGIIFLIKNQFKPNIQLIRFLNLPEEQIIIVQPTNQPTNQPINQSNFPINLQYLKLHARRLYVSHLGEEQVG